MIGTLLWSRRLDLVLEIAGDREDDRRGAVTEMWSAAEMIMTVRG